MFSNTAEIFHSGFGQGYGAQVRGFNYRCWVGFNECELAMDGVLPWIPRSSLASGKATMSVFSVLVKVNQHS